MLEASEVAKISLDEMNKGKFLITPHEIVKKYIKIKADDPEKWIIGIENFIKNMLIKDKIYKIYFRIHFKMFERNIIY